MKIAIDARPLARPLSGIGRYLLSLLEELCQVCDWQIYLYIDNDIDKSLVIDDYKIRVRQINKHWNVKGLRWIGCQIKFYQWLKQDKVDIFWSPRHHLPLSIPQHVKTILTIHDLVWVYARETMQKKNYWLERLLMPISVRRANTLVTVSQSSKNAIESYFHVSDVKVISPGSSLHERFQTTNTKTKLEPGYFLFVGTLEPRKNLHRLIEAYAALDQGIRKKRKLVIAGEFGWGERYFSEKAQHCLNTDVEFLGRVSDEELSSLYEHALCLVMPSLYEGFGIPLLEAMSYGKPILTSNNSSMPEVAGKAGILVNPNSIVDIKLGLERMATDNKLVKQLSRDALKQSHKFNWHHSAYELSMQIETLAKSN